MTQALPMTDEIRADFDRIAGLPDEGWDHNSHYHPFLMKNLPARCGETLEIGCGTGAFARQLADRADHVLALDLSPRMVRRAEERSAGHPNIEFEVADATTWPFPAGRFNAIASIATLHHLPLDFILGRLATALKPGGTLVVLDLYERKGIADALLDVAAVPTNYALRLAKGLRAWSDRRVSRAWGEHARHDSFLAIAQVRRIASGRLPGSVVRRHLFWRYSLIWKKPIVA